MKKIIKKYLKTTTKVADYKKDQYQQIKIKINTQTYQHLPGNNQSVWFSCSDSLKSPKKLRSQKQRLLGGRKLKQYPYCYIYVNAGKAGTLYFFLGKKNNLKRKRITESDKLYGKSETKNFHFNDDKKIIFFTYAGPWDILVKLKR